MCREALFDCLRQLRMAIVAYTELIGTLDSCPERDQFQVFAAELAGQHQMLQRLYVGRCGSSRCAAKAVPPARDLA